VQAVGIDIADGFIKKPCKNVICLPAEVVAEPSLIYIQLKYNAACPSRCKVFY
jgi:hypothetical protein